MLLKPAQPPQSNTVSETERGIKVLLYCEVLQLVGTKVYRCATNASIVIRTGTYVTDKAPGRGCIVFHLILCSMYSTATDRRCAMLNSNTSSVKKTVQQFKVCIGSRAPHCRTVVKSGQNKTTKPSPNEQFITKSSI